MKMPRTTRRIRSDGWTLPRQRMFIKTLAMTGSVKQAAARAEMSESSAYRLRLHPGAEAFRSAWETALGACPTTLRQVAFDRAINGVLEDVYCNGVAVGRRVVLNDRLLMFLLRHYDTGAAFTPQHKMLEALERLVEADDPAPEIVAAADAQGQPAVDVI
ncbi:hypothetical protein [Polymorphobacter fuscus]|uniref:LysR family transcriptional regulator n=1 Tax=Sandarakinorhabdus fusca TaxID=1439888 RepID=A0A7C9GRS6_9SPHN|nr:hypothetical protein [Polymorphobacter fuscus]KAB7643627.1 hypothetical protein F9290_15780 [Polymorphobacter fuscus]MQT18710.1 hypothetical protein [Polymorphobacter fuscus]NJC09598.1 hypothetical protein [Polymorphobacter fuscus]